MAQKIKTVAALAQRFRVSTKTVAAWRDNFEDWPGRRADGSFNLRQVAAFCKRHGLGPNNPRRVGDSQQSALDDARRRKLIEKVENRRIDNERQRAKQARELGRLVDADDVRRFYRQTHDVVDATHAKYIAELERLMPAEPPSTAEAWTALREAALELTRRLPRNVADAMKQIDA